MGKGLGIHSTGKHIAFTEGAGVSAFLDLVAHLILELVEHNGGPSVLSDLKDR